MCLPRAYGIVAATHGRQLKDFFDIRCSLYRQRYGQYIEHSNEYNVISGENWFPTFHLMAPAIGAGIFYRFFDPVHRKRKGELSAYLFRH